MVPAFSEQGMDNSKTRGKSLGRTPISFTPSADINELKQTFQIYKKKIISLHIMNNYDSNDKYIFVN
jgi:hypothetical protein